MISFDFFDQWLNFSLYSLVIVFFIIFFSIDKIDSFKQKFFVTSVLVFGLVIPFFVESTNHNAVLMRSGKIVNMSMLIFFGYVAKVRTVLLKQCPYFFYYWFATCVLILVESLFIEVLFAPKFIFLNKLMPILNYLKIDDYNFFSPFSYLIKFILLGLFFRDALADPQHKKLFTYLIVLLVIFECIMVIVFKSYQDYDSISSTIKNFFLLFGSSLLLFRIYNAKNHAAQLHKNFYFWVGISLFSLTLLELFLELVFTKLYQTDLVSFNKYYLVRNAMQIASILVFLKALWQIKIIKYIPNEY